MDKPYLSIVIPTYQRPVQLERCLTSLLAQKGNYEIIVMEDGSSDGITAVRKIHNDSRIRYFSSLTNQGAYGAINAAVLKCRGEVIAFLDDDAVILSGWVSRIIEVTAGQKEDCIITGHVKLLEETTGVLALIRQNYYENRYKSYRAPEYGKKLEERYAFCIPYVRSGYLVDHFSCSNVAMPKRLFEYLGGFHTGFRVLGSNEFALHALANGIPIFYDPQLKVAHQHDNSLASMIQKMWIYGAHHYLISVLYTSNTKAYPISIRKFVKLMWSEIHKIWSEDNLTRIMRLITILIVMVDRISYVFHANFRHDYITALSKKPRGLFKENTFNSSLKEAPKQQATLI